MLLESFKYGSISGDRDSERLRPDAEEARQCPQRSSGPEGEYEEYRPLAHNVIGARQKRVAVYFNLVLVASCLVVLVFGFFEATKYSDFSTTSVHPPPSHGSSKKQKHAMVYDCVLEQCSSVMNGIGGVNPSANSKPIMECLKNSNHDEAATCFENPYFSALDDKWSNSLHACCICEGCISGVPPSKAECNLIHVAMTMPLEMAWYPAVGSPESLNTWQYNGAYFRGDWGRDGDKRLGGGWMSIELVGGSEYDENLVSESSPQISPLVKNNPLDAYGCLLTRCSDFALKFETTNPVVAQQTWQCLANRTRDVDALSCLAHPTSVDVAECGSCKGCFSLGNIADVNIVCLKHAY
eukprot:62022_1